LSEVACTHLEQPGEAESAPGSSATRLSVQREVGRDTSLTQKVLYVLAAFCIAGIAMAYVVARANRTEAGLGIAIMSLFAIASFFAILDVTVLILLTIGFNRRFQGKHISIIALLLFLISAVALVLFLFTTCSVAVVTAD
jgi:hypothetical protein